MCNLVILNTVRVIIFIMLKMSFESLHARYHTTMGVLKGYAGCDDHSEKIDEPRLSCR